MQKTRSHARALSRIFTRQRLLLVGLPVVALCSILIFLLSTQLTVSFTLAQPTDHSVTKPLTITLSQKMLTIDTNALHISPEIAGTWNVHRGKLFSPDTLIFTPHDHFVTNTTYTVAIPSLTRALGRKTTPTHLTITTEKAPALTDTGLVTLGDTPTIAADYVPSITLSSPNRHLRDLTLVTSQKIDFTRSSVDDTTFTWKPAALWPQGKTITLKIVDKKSQQTLLTKTVDVAREPSLTSPLSRASVGERDSIELIFHEAMKPDETVISFSTPGKGSWKNDRTYQFTPTKLAPATTYAYTIKKGGRSTAGGYLTHDIKGSFATVGAVGVSQSSPWGSELSQSSQALRFTFNQSVDHASAQAHFSVNTGTVGAITWSGNTMIIPVSNLGYQRTVYATLSSGIKNAGFGAPSAAPFTLSFTTEIRSVRLNIPHYQQQHPSSCAVASLRMILAYRGTTTDEMTIVSRMGYAPRSMNKSTNPATWDDPSQMFVGSVDGSLSKGTGAGPDAGPVAKAARSFGHSASAVTGVSPTWVAQQIYAGNPVELFGAYGDGPFISWKTPSGRITKMNLASHARVITGVYGEPSNPIGFWVNDPLLDSAVYWTAASLQADINKDAYHQAVVVY